MQAEPKPIPSGRLGPTRPDKLSIWPVERERYGLDVHYRGTHGYKRAQVVQRQLEQAGVVSRFLQEVDGSWKIRLGPVERDHMLTVVNGFVW